MERCEVTLHSAVSIQWNGLLEWTTGMDYWNGLLECPLTLNLATKINRGVGFSNYITI